MFQFTYLNNPTRSDAKDGGLLLGNIPFRIPLDCSGVIIKYNFVSQVDVNSSLP